MAASGRRVFAAAVPLSSTVPLRRGAADDPGLAVPGCGRDGVEAFVVDRAAGCGASGPGDVATEVTAAQIRQLWARLRAAEQWCEGDPPVLVVCDAGYDVIRLAFLLADLPVRLLARIRSDRVFYAPAAAYTGTGRPSRHGTAMRLDDPATWPAPGQTAADVHERYGNVTVTAWGRYHPQLARRAPTPRQGF
jgi:hypothetical protein